MPSDSNIIKIAFLSIFLLFVPLVASSKNLSCYASKKPEYRKLPTTLISAGLKRNLKYSSTDEKVSGPPSCVVYFSRNDSHSVTWQGHVSQHALPFECFIKSHTTHCFPLGNQTWPFINKNVVHGWACCCATDNCNHNNPIIYSYLEGKVFIERLSFLRGPYFKLFFMILVFFVLVLIEALLEHLFFILYRKLMEKVRPDTEKPLPKIKKTMDADFLSSALDVATPVPKKSREKIDKTQSSKELSIVTPTKQLLTKEKPTITSEKAKKEEELGVEKTQSDEDDVVPIPEKPQVKVLPTGRVQRISMNFEESTFSDLDASLRK